MPTHRPCTLEDQDWEPPSESDMKLLQARRDRSDKVSKLMGDYLLKGYTMLATTCPICETILLQDRQRNNYCVACSELDSDVGKDDPALNHSAAISMAREIELASAGASGSAISLQSTTATAAAHIASTPQAVSALSGPQPQPNADPNTPATLDTCHTLSMTSIDVQSWPSNPNDLPRQELATGHNVTSIPDTETANPHLDSKSGLQFLSSSPRIALSSVKNDGQQVGLPYESCSSSSTSTCLQQLVEKVQWAGQELANTKSVEYSIQLCQLVKTASEAVVALRSARI